MSDPTGVAVPTFERQRFGVDRPFSRLGDGPIGGKASGLWVLRDQVLPALDGRPPAGFVVDVPSLAVVAGDVFTAFIQRNHLADLDPATPDDRIALAFLRAPLPAEWSGDLRALASQVQTPLAVRSSSTLEDALDHPLAGVYLTKMIPNGELDEDARFRRLEQAVKLVWASTFFADARSSRTALGVGRETMAVVVQEVVGNRRGDRFYPCVSGVARTHNHYPTGDARPEDGVVHLALGLGKTIVDGGRCWSYCPDRPSAPPPFNGIGDLLKSSQTRFWAIHMGEPPMPDPGRETECIAEHELAAAERDGALALVASTYDASSDRLVSGLVGRGPRAVTFAPLLGSRFIPFNDIVTAVMATAREVVGQDVELEFAVQFDPDDVLPARFGILQVRPMATRTGGVDIDADAFDQPGVRVATASSLGNGARDDILDVVWMPRDRFDPSGTRLAAADIDRLNSKLVAAGRPYLLIGFGRWGSSDDRFGLPVTWGQIAGAAVIVEATLPDVDPDLSQGSHFFHNLVGCGTLYLSVRWNGPDHIDWDWLATLPVTEDAGRVVHSRVERPLRVAVDGRARRGVVRHP
jgi:hypothetical protein